MPILTVLFVLAMSVVMKDAQDLLSGEEPKDLSTVLYADDTLLIGSSQEGLEKRLKAVSEKGP